MPLRGADDVRFAIDELMNKSERNIRGVALAIFTGVIEGTPVDTGRARSNWFLTEGAPSSKTRVNSQTTLRRGTGTKETKIPLTPKETQKLNKVNEFKIGKTWYLTNNLPYIEDLEYEGRSRQAPVGWVRRTIKRVRIQIKRGRL